MWHIIHYESFFFGFWSRIRGSFLDSTYPWLEKREKMFENGQNVRKFKFFETGCVIYVFIDVVGAFLQYNRALGSNVCKWEIGVLIIFF